MGFISSLRAPPRSRRTGAAFPAADLSRLTSSWTHDPGAVNRWLRHELRTLRARSRALARGDAYGARFVKACVNNIAGPKPFQLQAKAKFLDGRLNQAANAKLEMAWWEAGRPGVYEVTGKLSRDAFHRLKVLCLARDGEVLIRTLRGGRYGDSGIRQFLDIDRLDEQLNETRGANTIKMGVELDRDSRPVAYHLLKQHPGEMGEWNRGLARDHERVPAEEIEHLFIPDWPEQVRGFPWMHAGMLRLWHLGAFEEAAVINARIGANKLAVLQSPNGEPPATLVTGKDSAGNLLQDSEPGQYWTLPEGYEISNFSPQFPDTSVGPFIQACLRGVGASFGMSYHSFANDPGAVNYSTARVALLDERDGWMAIQQWYIEHSCEPEGVAWIENAVLDGRLPKDYFRYRNALYYQPRTWQWIDPEKEVKAKSLALEARITSRTRIARENGEDYSEIIDELAADEQMATEKGVKLEAAPNPAPAAKTEPENEDDEAGG